MPVWLKAAGKWGSILVLIALLITFVKQLIALIAFLTGAIKLFIILAFIVLIVGVGFMILKGLKSKRPKQD